MLLGLRVGGLMGLLTTLTRVVYGGIKTASYWRPSSGGSYDRPLPPADPAARHTSNVQNTLLSAPLWLHLA